MSNDIFEGLRPPEADAGVVKTFVDPEKLAADMRFNPAEIDAAMINQAALYAHYAQLAAKATLQRDTLKTRLELLEAQLDKQIRVKLEEEGVKKVTEAMVSAKIRRNIRYIKAKAAFDEAEAVQTLLFQALKALEMKRDMMVQINKNQEREWAYSNALAAAERRSADLAEKRETVEALLRGSKLSPKKSVSAEL